MVEESEKVNRAAGKWEDDRRGPIHMPKACSKTRVQVEKQGQNWGVILLGLVQWSKEM